MFLALKSNVNKLNQTKWVKKCVLLCYLGFKIGKKKFESYTWKIGPCIYTDQVKQGSVSFYFLWCILTVVSMLSVAFYYILSKTLR